MQFRILGPLEVVDGEQPIVLRKGKECALLTYLVVAPDARRRGLCTRTRSSRASG